MYIDFLLKIHICTKIPPSPLGLTFCKQKLSLCTLNEQQIKVRTKIILTFMLYPINENSYFRYNDHTFS